MRKWLWGGIPLVLCAAAGAWLYARHMSDGTRVPQVIKVVGEIVEAARPIPLANPETSPELTQATPKTGSLLLGGGVNSDNGFFGSPVADVVEPIVVENREESQRVVEQVRSGQIFVVGAEETSEPVIGPGQDPAPDYMPYAEEERSPTAECCAGFWGWLACCEHTECPCSCCDWVMELVKKLAAMVWSPAPSLEVDNPAANDGEAQEPPLSRQDRFDLPSMREDPNYHHHYPSCPYTGGCPYPYYQYRQPTQPINRVAPPTPSLPAAPSTPKSQPHRPLSRALPPSSAAIDTMECRPSDLPPLPRGDRPF